MSECTWDHDTNDIPCAVILTLGRKVVSGFAQTGQSQSLGLKANIITHIG